LEAYPPVGVIFTGIGNLLSVSIPLDLSSRAIVTSVSQAAQAVGASRDVLVDLFERMENIFRRLETYTSVPPTAGMTDAIMKVLVEVLCILAIATKEIKQSRLSKLILYSEMDQAFWLIISQKNS
jgi:uncharacterized UPF0146 family protein